jgi:hypothetical protein
MRNLIAAVMAAVALSLAVTAIIASTGPRNGPVPCPPVCGDHSPYMVRDWQGRSGENPEIWVELNR